MRPQRILKYLNLLIAVLVLAFAVAAAWFVWRPLPKTSGTVQAPLAAAATVTRDSNGVPHIRAASIEDALFLQGYVTAQDRLWQMDAIRRLASGQLSEIIGAATLEVDREARKLRLRRMAEQHVATLPAEDRKWIDAYCRGVNHFLNTHWDSLPVEFTLLQYKPSYWTPVDTLVVGMQMYRDLTTSWKTDLGKAAMLARGDANLVEQLFPPRAGPDVQPGSNAWAISGRHTATGKPILANDPHLEWGLPSTWYMVRLEAPGMNVAGVSLPGVAGVIIGHNDRIAWGVTNLQFDVQDLYVERLDPRTGQYVVDGRVEQAQLEREVIPVKGASPVEFANWITRHGPVWTTTGAQSLTLKWTAAEPKRFEFPFVQLNRARNWDEFRTALRRFHGPGQNFVYADVDGNIGYQATGALPIRRNFRGDAPVDGASGQFEWEGFTEFDDLPTAFNPASGMVITANQSPFPHEWKYPVSGFFDAGYRAHQIRSLLTARSGWKPEDMLAVQKDVYSPFLHALSKTIEHPVLRGWNGQMEKGMAAPMLMSLFYTEVRRRIAERASPEGATSYLYLMAPAAILDLVERKPAGWFPDWSKVLNESLRAAIDEGAKTQGSDPAKWRYGASAPLELRHPVISQVPWLGQRFNVGPAVMSGSSTTVKQTTPRLGPSMRFVADLSDWNRSVNNITLGQSGQILSSHYKDQWDEYYYGRSLPMLWSNVQGDVLRFEP